MGTLADTFRAALGARAPQPSAALDEAVERLARDASAAWPSIRIDPHDFVRAAAERIEADDDALAALGQMRGGDLWLAFACARGDAAAVRAFDAHYLSKVPGLIRRVDDAGQLSAEVVQQLRDSLLVPDQGRARIADYSGRGDLLGWLRVVALRTALKLRRRKLRAAGEPLEDGKLPEEMLAGPDPERDYLRLRYRGDYETAFRDAMAALPAPERLLLKLHYVDALSLERLAALQRVHRATVARRLAEARRKVLDGTRDLLRQRLSLTDSEFESVLALVRSQLAVSVRSALS